VRAAVLEYHDVVPDGAWETSGFGGRAANSYKVSTSAFHSHLETLRGAHTKVVGDVRGLAPQGPTSAPTHTPVLITFDDGGVGAMAAADALEQYDWRGHFFVATSCIGTRGFLTPALLQELASRGHVIGSHSHSHPLQIGRLGADVVEREWRDSVDRLQQLLGTGIDVASVPGGYYRPFVAVAAATAGIRWLFTSEPVVRVEQVAGVHVLGRYTIRTSTPTAHVRSLLASPSVARLSQWVQWNSKKLLKRAAGDAYLRLRSSLFGDAAPADGDAAP
jgi:peptidoglycan/xylan/chitin deacetylase (PgdA/CDA1 family)